jgi:hypothetical protein
MAVYSERLAATRAKRCAGLLLGYGLVDVDRIGRGVQILASVYRNMVRRSRAVPAGDPEPRAHRD